MFLKVKEPIGSALFGSLWSIIIIQLQGEKNKSADAIILTSLSKNAAFV